MKTFGAFLALAAVVASADALARFDKASCLSSAPTTPINVVAGDGSWNCVDFNLAQTGVFTMPFIKSGSANVALEIMLWNDGRADSDPTNGNYRWDSRANSNAAFGTLSDNVWLRKFIPGANGEQNDFNGVDFSQNVTQGGEAMAMSTIAGWNTNALGNGIYAWYTGDLVNFAQGRNYIQMLHPNRMSSSAVSGSFGGKFMYRLLARNGLQDNVNGASLDESLASSYLPTLNVGRSTSVQHLALPSFTLNFRVNHEFATAGYALKGFAFTAAYGGNRVGSLVNQRNYYNLPVGYSAYANANLTFPSLLEAGNGKPLYQNYTKTGQFSPADGVEQIDFASDITTFKKNWTLPLDVDSTTDAEKSNFGQLGVYVPDFSLAPGVADALAYDWSSQTSPFIDVTVTIDEVATYPMLSELRNLHLRNWDTDEAKGHNVLSPTQQQAFGLYRVRIDSPLWWAMRVRFNDVRDMNAPSGVAAGEPLPEACQPLWEMQVVNDFNDGGSTFSNNEGTAFGRRQNGFGVEFPTYHTNRDNNPEGIDWEASFGGSKLEENGQTYALNRAWAQRSGAAIRGVDQELAFLASTRPSWYLVRVSALPRILPGLATFDGQCGSNNIRIGSASLELLGVAGECSSSRDCMVEGDGHPAEDRADSDDSANGDATRFSRCVVTNSLTADGRRAPTTQCVECSFDSHCRSGQYCHTDDGLCTLPANSPAQFTRYYTCDAESRALRGVCREKSTDVLGKTCKPHTLSTQTAFNTMKHPALNDIFSSVDGGSAGLTRGSTPIFSPNELDPQEFDPSNDDFGTGSGGICGEFRYYNSTGVSSAVSAPLQGTTNDPAFSLAGTVRRGLWWGMCDEDRICRECVPGSGSQGNNAKDGRICLNGQMFSAADVDGTNRSYTANTQAGTQLGTTFMVILLIILFAFYMYAQAKEFRHENGLKPMSCCECILCCGACSKLGGAADAPKEPAAATADDSKVAPTA